MFIVIWSFCFKLRLVGPCLDTMKMSEIGWDLSFSNHLSILFISIYEALDTETPSCRVAFVRWQEPLRQTDVSFTNFKVFIVIILQSLARLWHCSLVGESWHFEGTCHQLHVRNVEAGAVIQADCKECCLYFNYKSSLIFHEEHFYCCEQCSSQSLQWSLFCSSLHSWEIYSLLCSENFERIMVEILFQSLGPYLLVLLDQLHVLKYL